MVIEPVIVSPELMYKWIRNGHRIPNALQNPGIDLHPSEHTTQSSPNVTDLEKKENDGWNRLLDLDNLDNSRQEPEAITATTAMYSILRHQHASMSAFHVLSARRRRISAPRRVRDSQPTKNTRRIWWNPSTDRQRSLLTHQSSNATLSKRFTRR